MRSSDQALWIGLSGVIAATGVYFAFRSSPNETPYMLLTLIALLCPLAAAKVLGAAPKDWLGQLPPAWDIAFSAAAGVSLWGASWWLMNIANDELFRRVGLYVPVLARLDSWAMEVSYFVVLMPLASACLIFGGMRAALPQNRRSLFFLALYFAILATVTTPQGLVSLLGYGLLGLVASFLSLQTRSLLVGFAPYAGFMYMNLAFLDELGLELGGVSYSDTRWLTLVLFSLFFTVLAVQVIRFRNSAPPKESEKPSVMGYAALLLLLLALIFISAGELERRNQYKSELIQAIDPDITAFTA